MAGELEQQEKEDTSAEKLEQQQKEFDFLLQLNEDWNKETAAIRLTVFTFIFCIKFSLLQSSVVNAILRWVVLNYNSLCRANLSA